jgi:hypothetical protein
MNIERGREQEPCSRVSPHVNAGRGKLLTYGYPAVRISARLLCRAFFFYKIPITTCETVFPRERALDRRREHSPQGIWLVGLWRNRPPCQNDHGIRQAACRTLSPARAARVRSEIVFAYARHRRTVSRSTLWRPWQLASREICRLLPRALPNLDFKIAKPGPFLPKLLILLVGPGGLEPPTKRL